MTLRDTVIDAVLEAIEKGATPPEKFTVRVPGEVLLVVRTPVRVLGMTIHLRADDLPEPEECQLCH